MSSFTSEAEMLLAFTRFFVDVDPDIVVSWEIQQSGLGYILNRGMSLGLPLRKLMSRTIFRDT